MGPAIGPGAWASADPCVDVVVRSAQVEGRRVVSVDLHGDGLVKSAVPPHLAAELLARAAPSDGGDASTACVPATLAQSLFDPLINPAGFDAAARLARIGDRWVLAGTQEAKPPARGAEPIALAAATRTRGDLGSQGTRARASSAGEAHPPIKPTRKNADSASTRSSPNASASPPEARPLQLAAAAPAAEASVPGSRFAEGSRPRAADRRTQEAEAPLSPVQRVLGTSILRARALSRAFSLRPDQAA